MNTYILQTIRVIGGIYNPGEYFQPDPGLQFINRVPSKLVIKNQRITLGERSIGFTDLGKNVSLKEVTSRLPNFFAFKDINQALCCIISLMVSQKGINESECRSNMFFVTDVNNKIYNVHIFWMTAIKSFTYSQSEKWVCTIFQPKSSEVYKENTRVFSVATL